MHKSGCEQLTSLLRGRQAAARYALSADLKQKAPPALPEGLLLLLQYLVPKVGLEPTRF